MRFPNRNDVKLWYKRVTHRALVSPTDDVALVRRVHGRHLPRWSQIRQMGRLLSSGERRLIHVSTLVCVIGVLWFGTLYVAGHRLRVAADGGRYVEAVVGAPQLVNPIFANGNDADMDIVRLVYSGLLRYDENGKLVPDLAAKYTVSDDKKTYTFELKHDVLWHDGEPFTARDVAYTFETIQNTAVGSPLLSSFQGVTVDVVDDYTVRFILQEPFSPFISTLTVGMLPEHVWQEITPDHMRLAQMNLKPVGTGPYQFHTFTKGDTGTIYTYELRRFDRYYGVKPHITEFAFQFFSDYKGDAGAIQALRSQHVDGINFVPYDVRDQVERKHVALHTLELPQYTAVFFNMDAAGISTPEVRAALSDAIDTGRIIREGVRNEAQPIVGPILPGMPGYKSDRPVHAYDPDRANTALAKITARVAAEEFLSARRAELGKQWDTAHPVTTTPSVATSTIATVSSTPAMDKAQYIQSMIESETSLAQTFYRKTKQGAILSVGLVTADTPEYHQIAGLIVGFWQDIGVKTTVTYVAPKDMAHDVLRDRVYDALLYSVIIGSDPDQYPFWHSSQVTYPGLNLSRYTNRTVDGLLEKARAATGDDADKLYGQFEDAILKDRPAIFLYSPTYTYATTDRIMGIDAKKIFHPSDRFADVVTWYVKTAGVWSWGSK